MIRSMTGYAAASADSPRGTLSIELRSVNSRFLDLAFRVADELRALEPAVREMIGARVARGKVECRLLVGELRTAAAAQELDPAALQRLKVLAEEAKRAFPDADGLRVADVLRWPGVLAEPPADERRMREIAEKLARQALDELVAAREREGARLAAIVGERITAMRRALEKMAPHLPRAIAAYEEKLKDKLREALGSADDERVRAEIAVFAVKADIGEELDRLRTHLAEAERTLQQGGAAGKRLDFIAQELNREANTIAAKAVGAPLSDGALELKLLIEQMREQVQNIE